MTPARDIRLSYLTGAAMASLSQYQESGGLFGMLMDKTVHLNEFRTPEVNSLVTVKICDNENNYFIYTALHTKSF